MLRRCLALGVLLVTWTAPASAQAPLPQATVELLRAANIPQEAVGAVAMKLGDGSLILAHQAERSLQPASTLKVLTAIVGLDRLGPAWRARTEMVATAAIVHGQLGGDLALRGGGSPDFDWRALERMLEQLRFQGVRRIAGDVILDRSRFEPPRTDVGLPPFDETPEFRYNVVPDALALNTNLVQLDLAADGAKLRTQLSPRLQGVTVDTRGMRIVERDCAAWEDGWQLPTVVRERGGRLRVVLHGDFPAACTATTSINVIDRVEFGDRLFRALWTGMGGRLDGVVRDGAAPAGARVLAEHTSRTLAEFTRDILKRSDNPATRLLYLTLGTLPGAVDGPPPTTARAERVVRGWLSERGLSGEGLVLENGSGLSRRERITPLLLANVLMAAARSDWAPEFMATLPIVGVDAAMERRLAKSPAAVRGRFKTGGLRNVASVAGFVPDANGQMCVVVAIINQEPSGKDWGKRARPALDSVIDWVARSGGK